MQVKLILGLMILGAALILLTYTLISSARVHRELKQITIRSRP